jgi:hypothetical protein
MKYLKIIWVVLMVAVIVSCQKDKDIAQPSYIQFDAKLYNLHYGIIHDYTTNPQVPYRKYGIMLQDVATFPSFYIMFFIFPDSTSGLASGTYVYSWAPEANSFSFLNYGRDLAWYNANITGGTLFQESSTNVISGKIIVNKNNNNNFVFDWDIKVKDIAGNGVSITGKFSQILTKGDIPEWADGY